MIQNDTKWYKNDTKMKQELTLNIFKVTAVLCDISEVKKTFGTKLC